MNSTFLTFLKNVSSSSFSPPPETSRSVLRWLLQTVAYAVYRFLGHWTIQYFLFWNTCLYFLPLNWGWYICNVTLRLVTHALLFPSGLSIIIIMTFVHIHTPTSLSPKNCSKNKNKVLNLKSAKIKCFLRCSIAKIQQNSKKNRQISIHGFQGGSQK
jgi:hypothetical protein